MNHLIIEINGVIYFIDDNSESIIIKKEDKKNEISRC